MITRKAQVSMEFLFVVGFILFVFLLLLGFVFQRRSEVDDTKDFLEKKGECLRIASLISSVYSGGDGTTANIETDYLITIYNYSSIGIESIENISTYENRIAVLASEAGPTSQQFYDVVNESLEPDWYKTCFTDLGGSGCDWNNPLVDEVEWNLIENTLSELIANVDDYNTIYLEDSHIQYNAEYDGRSYFDIIEDWVSNGNSLILSEHVVCREGSGSYSSTSYRCNPPGYNSDVWDIFNHKIHQRGGSYGNDVTVIIDPNIDIFPNLDLGDSFDFEEDSYIEEVQSAGTEPGTDETADDGNFQKNNEGYTQNQGGYIRTQAEDCPGSGTSRQCTDNYAWETGYDDADQYVPVDFNATFIFDLSALGITGSDINSLLAELGGCWNGGTNYCDNGDNPEFRDGTNGNFEVLLYNGDSYERLSCVGPECEPDDVLLLGDYNTAPSWGNSDAYNEFSYEKTSGFNNNYVQDNQIFIRLHTWGTNHRNNYEVWQEIDYIFLTIDYDGKQSSVQPEFTVLAEYDDNSQPGIAYWEYGNGTIFYFGDFQVEVAKQDDYSGAISDLIERAYTLIIPKEEGKVSCYFAAESPFYRLTGDLTIKNENGAIIVTNETE